jgi:hypothetical protein
MPQNIGKSKNAQYLGKSKGGVSLATICGKYRLRVFNLVESNGQIDWELKHNVGLHPLKSLPFCDFTGFKKTWTLDDEAEDNDKYDDNNYDDDDDMGEGDGDEEREQNEGEEGEKDGMHMRENMEWNSDDDNVLNTEDGDYGCFHNLYFLGFHPFKEVVFLSYSPFIAVTYDLRSSKIQYLGKMRPNDYFRSPTNGIYEAYVYTPCMIGELQNHVSMSQLRYSRILAARRLSMLERARRH